MNTPRLARSRSRFFIILGVFIITLCFVAIFHSSQQQLDELKQLEIRCEQKQESLTAQILVFEKTIKSERHDHQQAKSELHKNCMERKAFMEQNLMEANTKLIALQQNYKLLRIQNEDLASEYNKDKEQRLEESNKLEEHLHEKDKQIESLKMQVKQMKAEKELLSDELKRKKEYLINPLFSNKPTTVRENTKLASPSEVKNFNVQIPIMPKPLQDTSNNVLAEPPQSNGKNELSSSSDGKDLGKFDQLQNAPLPTATAISKTKTSSTTASTIINKSKFKKVPKGVVPVQPNVDEMLQINKNENEAAENDPANNNRYNHVVDNVEEEEANRVKGSDALSAKERKSEKQSAIDADAAGVIANPADANDIDNAAHEVGDNNDFLVDDRNHKDHLQVALDETKLSNSNNINNNNNAAEDDTNLYDKNFNRIKANNGDNGLEVVPVHKNDKLSANSKLLNELDADQGQVGYDMPIEEAAEEDDDDDYANPGDRKQDPAVRN